MIKQIIPEEFGSVPRVSLRRWPGMILHHSGIRPKRNRLYGESIDRYHRQGKNWFRGMGYHVLINMGGQCEVGERWLHQFNGAHCIDYNDWIGIGLMGNFDSIFSRMPTKEQLRSLRIILSQFPALTILPHGALWATNCPGKRITANYWFSEIDPKI